MDIWKNICVRNTNNSNVDGKRLKRDCTNISIDLTTNIILVLKMAEFIHLIPLWDKVFKPFYLTYLNYMGN